jgi:RNA polymerase sigma factor (sigma-70 family)
VNATDALYEQLFATQFASVVRLAHLLGADDPQDVAQEAFVRIHAVLPRLRHRDAVLAYLRRTVINLSRSRHRHLRLVKRRQWELVPRDVESAESVVTRQESHREVLEALGRLEQRQREILTLRYWGQLTVPEIASALDIPEGTVKSSMSRALRKLETMLGDNQ